MSSKQSASASLARRAYPLTWFYVESNSSVDHCPGKGQKTGKHAHNTHASDVEVSLDSQHQRLVIIGIKNITRPPHFADPSEKVTAEPTYILILARFAEGHRCTRLGGQETPPEAIPTPDALPLQGLPSRFALSCTLRRFKAWRTSSTRVGLTDDFGRPPIKHPTATVLHKTQVPAALSIASPGPVLGEPGPSRRPPSFSPSACSSSSSSSSPSSRKPAELP